MRNFWHKYRLFKTVSDEFFKCTTTGKVMQNSAYLWPMKITTRVEHLVDWHLAFCPKIVDPLTTMYTTSCFSPNEKQQKHLWPFDNCSKNRTKHLKWREIKKNSLLVIANIMLRGLLMYMGPFTNYVEKYERRGDSQISTLLHRLIQLVYLSTKRVVGQKSTKFCQAVVCGCPLCSMQS